MRSKTSIELYSYWNKICGNRQVPQRQEIEPGDIRRILPDLFILEHVSEGDIRIRLAGTNICNLFGRELRGTGFESFWNDDTGHSLVRTATQVMLQSTAAVLSATGHTATGDHVAMEMTLLPLTSAGDIPDRLIGALTLLEHPAWMNGVVLVGMTLEGLRVMDPSKANAFLENRPEIPMPSAIAAMRSGGIGNAIRRVLHLRVLDGGRAD